MNVAQIWCSTKPGWRKGNDPKFWLKHVTRFDISGRRMERSTRIVSPQSKTSSSSICLKPGKISAVNTPKNYQIRSRRGWPRLMRRAASKWREFRRLNRESTKRKSKSKNKTNCWSTNKKWWKSCRILLTRSMSRLTNTTVFLRMIRSMSLVYRKWMDWGIQKQSVK